MLDYNFITKHKANQLVDVSGFIYLMDQLFARAPKARALTTIKWNLQVSVLQNVGRFLRKFRKSAVT